MCLLNLLFFVSLQYYKEQGWQEGLMPYSLPWSTRKGLGIQHIYTCAGAHEEDNGQVVVTNLNLNFLPYTLKLVTMRYPKRNHNFIPLPKVIQGTCSEFSVVAQCFFSEIEAICPAVMLIKTGVNNSERFLGVFGGIILF